MLQAVRLLTELARPSDNRRDSDNMEPAQASSSDVSVQFREIYKNGWLRRTDKTDKETSRFWVAFCVHDDTEPRLEGFTDQKQATTHSPLWANSLRGIQHISPTLCATSRHDYEFCVNFNDDRVLRLAAPTYQGMLDWVQLVTRKLTDMKILRPKENVYSRGPERIATRDPTSPLPPPPLPAGPEGTVQTPPGTPSSGPSTSSPGMELEAIVETHPMVFTFEDISIEERRRPVQAQTQRTTPPTPSPRVIPAPDPADSGYESIFMASSYSVPGDSSRSAVREPAASQESSNDRYAALMEYRSSGPSENRESARSASSAENVRQAPATSVRTGGETRPGAANIPRQLTLREQQIYQLKREMSHRAGVRLQLGRRDCKDSIAFVDSFGSIWIAGWKQKEHPFLYNVLHVGDMVISVAGISPPNAATIRDIMKGITTPRVEVIVRRLPYAQAMTLTKRTDTEDFGLEVNGNEVSGVSGVALNLGLLPLADATDPTAPAGSNTTWTLTEINGRPLNIFDGGAAERLRAVGRDISIVIQPTDLVSSLRKKLRVIRSYKNFILQ
ncbi:uncharacterized protein LOC107038231 [Diachasma alloeum]|uniref:uncharacterized protein LOC107038231 n=1 Tax=Diachasma alloeum TaxID=454923 RepID=UPI000738323F|nr:uncharacterized protein LOC107038231 [Diachasma alloeum]